jgi:membrane protease YdiL (CAAX protease family)
MLAVAHLPDATATTVDPAIGRFDPVFVRGDDGSILMLRVAGGGDVRRTTGQVQRSTSIRVALFALAAFAASWAWWLPIAFTGRTVGDGGWPTHLPGLVGPALAALAMTALFHGRSGARQLVARILHWRIGWWWLVALSPVALLAASLVALKIAGHPLPQFDDFGRINGFPLWSPSGVLLLLLVAGLGEETGWRAYLQPLLQQRMRPIAAMLVVGLIWTAWHAPLFAILRSYRGFTPVTLVGLLIGLTAGAIVLGWFYNRTGSVLAVAVWHATFNLATATQAADGLPAAVCTTVVIMAATTIVVADLATRGRILAPQPS